MLKKKMYVLSILLAFLAGYANACFSQAIKIEDKPALKKIIFGNDKMELQLDYNSKANIASLVVNGQQVITGDSGIYSAIKTKTAFYSTLSLSSIPKIKIKENIISVEDINYGDEVLTVKEKWIFTVTSDNIQFNIERKLSKSIIVEKEFYPVFNFDHVDTWEGAYQDYGGLAWFYLFNKKYDTYGVHSTTSRFWNSKTGNGLTVAVSSEGKQAGMDYNRTATDKIAFTVALSKDEMLPRFDSGTNRRRYIRDTTANVWSSSEIKKGKTKISVQLSYFDFNEKFGRGKLVGVNGAQVNAVLNTIARIGVIDKEHFGGNSWHTPYGPICLHEQYIGQMGLAINDNSYLKGYEQCLDFYRDNAIRPDGRVWPRWAYSNEDAMPKVFTDKGFYEAQWGYLLDSNPDFVTNVAELYDQTGNLDWVKTQQSSCEKALDWIMKRDSNSNCLVEMMTDSHKERRGSDWIDIIWAAYENAFVNANLYHALVLWADVERQLGDTEKQKYYTAFAEKLKASFNKPTTEGGLWDADKKCYIHWRDKDGSIHGNNLVTPVNFMAIAYGICDDDTRKKAILDNIETQMQKENLFFWPLCMYSYAPTEGNDWQFPFPAYENGDIFLSWGSVAVKAYAAYKPEIALKYVNKVLAQYEKDGLAFQRYGRIKQDGLGDDILAGNSLSVVGLYQSIYGINPLYNRFYLDPHITKELAGTQVRYNYRDQQLLIDLDLDKYAVSNNQFKIISQKDFGFFSTGNELLYFNGNTNNASLKLSTESQNNLTLNIQKWQPDEISFTQSSKESSRGSLNYMINNLKPDSYYTINVNSNTLKRMKSNMDGSLTFDYKTTENQYEVNILNK